ncbi:DNA-binding protein [Candidatus Woesearchaeota archaeon]|nr:DNA-binding protein [Candidatus Woesearchaeota archaeon]
MKKVILDTNFLLIPIQFGVDIFSEIDDLVLEDHKLLVLDKSIDELKGIIETQKGTSRQAAKLALQLLECKGSILETNSKDYADDVIVNLANDETIVCTQDRELRKRVKEKKARIIGMKQQNYLDFI